VLPLVPGRSWTDRIFPQVRGLVKSGSWLYVAGGDFLRPSSFRHFLDSAAMFCGYSRVFFGTSSTSYNVDTTACRNFHVTVIGASPCQS
jgi:hypothetical protein